MSQPLPPLTKDEILVALDAIWSKATNDQRTAIDALADAVRQRGVGGGEHPVSLAAGSMTPPPLPPPPAAHAATDWGSGRTDGGDESGGEVEGGWARYL
jgi:hypothetical protein